MPILPAIAPLGIGSGFPYPTSSQIPELGQTWEAPTIAGIPMPGQWILTSCKRQFGWQEQQATFLTGAFLVPKGDPLMHFEYTINIWEAGTFTLFRGLLGTLLKKPVASLSGIPASAALGIDDPSLKDLGVTACVVDAIDYPLNPIVSSGGKGAWVGKISFIEWRPARPALPVPDQAIPDPGAVTPGASANLATAQAAVAAGDAARQAAKAAALVPPK